MNCRHCGSAEINEDRRRGDTVCMSCGAVLEEGMIVNEVEFQDSATGSAQVIGQFMSSDASGFLPGSASLASKLGFQRESRQLTLNNARRRLQLVGGQLRLSQHQIDMAYNFYRTILNRGWTRGRKVNYVIAACLYIVCRTEGTHHMLLDLSDLLQVNVYVLGRSYTEIAKRLCINIPALDPCLYIQRFAQKLEFGEKSREVETTAMRLLQRMKKDWIAVGRRPAGLAASALLVAGRLHNYNRTVEDVARIAKISEQTARKRLQEFAKTPSSTLTIEEFLSVDYEEEHDPPAFLEGLRRAGDKEEDLDKMCQEVGQLEALIDREMEKLQEKRVRGIVSGLFNAAAAAAPRTSTASASSSLSTVVAAATAGSASAGGDSAGSFLLNCDDAEVNLSARQILKDALEGVVDAEELDCCVDDLHQAVATTSTTSTVFAKTESTASMADDDVPLMPPHGVDQMMAAVGIGRVTSAPSMLLDVKPQLLMSDGLPIALSSSSDPAADEQLSLEGIDDEELEREYLLSRREVLIKARDWYRRNADWLKQDEQRRRSRAAATSSVDGAGGDASAADGVDAADGRRSAAAPRRRTKRTAHVSGIQTTEQAIEVAIRSKRALSSKINYEALKLLTEPLKQPPVEDATTAELAMPPPPQPPPPPPPPAVVKPPPPPPPSTDDGLPSTSTLSKSASSAAKSASAAAAAAAAPALQSAAGEYEDYLEEEEEEYDELPNVLQLLKQEGAGQYGAAAEDFDDDEY